MNWQFIEWTASKKRPNSIPRFRTWKWQLEWPVQSYEQLIIKDPWHCPTLLQQATPNYCRNSQVLMLETRLRLDVFSKLDCIREVRMTRKQAALAEGRTTSDIREDEGAGRTSTGSMKGAKTSHTCLNYKHTLATCRRVRKVFVTALDCLNRCFTAYSFI